MIGLLTFASTGAFAGELTVTRTPAAIESAEPEAPTGSYNDAEQASFSKRLDTWKRTVDAIGRTDQVLRRELPVVAACWGKAGDVPVRLIVTQAGIVSRATAGKGSDAALTKCLESTYKGQQFATLTTTGDTDIVWQVHFEPPASAPSLSPVERDLGFGETGFGAGVSALGSVMQIRSTSYDTAYGRELDSKVRWFGEACSKLTYLFDKEDAFYGAVVEIDGETAAFNLRSALKSRYGQPRWDPQYRAWYWRGSQLLIVALDRTDEAGAVVSVFDHVRAKHGAGIANLPGESSDPAAATQRLPSIFKQ